MLAPALLRLAALSAELREESLCVPLALCLRAILLVGRRLPMAFRRVAPADGGLRLAADLLALLARQLHADRWADVRAADEELLEFAEKTTDETLQTAVISYVEILIEIESCEIAYEKRRLKAKRKRIERQVYEEHQRRLEKINRYIEAIRKKEFPVNAERLVMNYFKTSRKDADGAFKMLTNNPATFAPIEVSKIKARFFGLIKARPEDGIRINKELGKFLKNLKV